jgi:hypothetical protein
VPDTNSPFVRSCVEVPGTKNFERLAALLDLETDFRGLTPGGSWRIIGARAALCADSRGLYPRDGLKKLAELKQASKRPGPEDHHELNFEAGRAAGESAHAVNTG